MERGVPCCAADAARRVRRIGVGGNQVAIVQLDRILGEVQTLGLEDVGRIAAELLRRAKVFNYIPPGAEDRYAEALLGVYMSEKEGRK